MGYTWAIVRKKMKIMRSQDIKARLVAQGFFQRPGIDYEETYSPVVDAITLRYLIGLTVYENLDMHLMDVVTAYLYESLD
uniref:reverse transcriptase domain-containing protein n=1 Tax=Picosynechococcus sp. (strain ATCC 27264 / PCC 7002 / PR-6) TaxID=32049 RepID=UPI0030D86486